MKTWISLLAFCVLAGLLACGEECLASVWIGWLDPPPSWRYEPVPKKITSASPPAKWPVIDWKRPRPDANRVGPTTSYSQYETWARRFAEKRPYTWFEGRPASLRLVITMVYGDDEPGPESRFRSNYYLGCGSQLAVDGRIGEFHFSSDGGGGGGGSAIPAADLKRVNELIPQLPEDGSKLPPEGRRLIVQVNEVGGYRAFVYDLANPPKEVLELVRLCPFPWFRTWLPSFEPAGKWNIAAPKDFGGEAMSLSPDGRFIVTADSHGGVRFWDIDTHKLVREVAVPYGSSADEISLSPDGSFTFLKWAWMYVMDTKTWQCVKILEEPEVGRTQHGLRRPQFIEDGRLLLLETTEPALRFFDAKMWKATERPPEIPSDAVKYILAPEGKAIYVSKDGVVRLWDSTNRAVIAKLDENADIRQVAISPDGSLAAIGTYTEADWQFHIRIWSLEDGRLVRELNPLERETCYALEGLVWSPDSKYILAADNWNRSDTSTQIEVFNIERNRVVGVFRGSGGRLVGLLLSPDGHELMALDRDGKLRFWDFIRAFKEIRAFEKSLGGEELVGLASANARR